PGEAPPTEAEKARETRIAPSAVPGVDTSLPLLLAEARAGRLSYEQARDLTAASPAAVFDLPRKGRVEEGKDADLALFDPDTAREIRGEEFHSKAGWTPFEGWDGIFPEWTMVRGETVYRNDGNEEFGDARGENVRSGE